jgi:SAM-dependent methyltransferase
MSAASFAQYARAYDLLYRGKDYAAEARWVDAALTAGGRARGTLLEVGCGTGGHARVLAGLGWQVTGVDLSADMLAIARGRTAAGAAVDYVQGAAAEVALGRTFTAAASLFHVMSYQAEPGELERALANVRRHLASGGRFVFDFWHGPGVQADPPALRVRRADDAASRLTRIAEPRHDAAARRIDVAYELFLEDRAEGGIVRIEEVHRLRYFFRDEVEAALRGAGFGARAAHAGIDDAPLDARAWYGLIVAEAV